MKKYNGIYMNHHYRLEDGVDYWFIYEHSDNPDESGDVALFPGEEDQILLQNVDLGSCGYILFKAGEYKIQCNLPLSSNILGEFFVDTDFPLEIHEVAYTRFLSETSAEYHIYIDTAGFCAAKQSMLIDDKEVAAAVAVGFEPGCKNLGHRTIEKMYSVYHGVDITPQLLEYVESSYSSNKRDVIQLFNLMASMSMWGYLKFSDGDIIFDSGIFGGERTMRIRENGKEEKVFRDDAKEPAFMSWVL